MAKPLRVAPKNIQFEETVYIKEIPHEDDEGAESAQQSPWDPNLNNKNVLKEEAKVLQKIVIGIIIAGAVILLIVVAIVLGVVLSQNGSSIADNSLTYNAVCKVGSSQCKSSQGLSCIYGFCSCSSPYSWNTAVTSCTLLTYGQSCSTSSQCNSSLGLNCTSQICDCDSYHSWSSSNNTCTTIQNNTLTYGSRCVAGSSQCNSSVNLICTGNCSCVTTTVWNTSVCLCPSGTFLNSSNLCETQYRINRTCTMGSNQCDSSRGLSCNNSLCICESTKYWNLNYETCFQRLNYSEACSADGDCVPTLSCPTIPGVCNCPLSLPDYVCNCANTQFYNTTTQQCVTRATLSGVCTPSLNYTCGISLYCNAGICNCPTGTTWVSANSTCV